MHQTAKLSDLAEAEIGNLEREGIILTPSEVVEINALAWDVEQPESRRLLSRGVPVACGGVYLWPLTLYGQEWFSRVGCEMDGIEAQTYALAYAMARGRDDGEPLAIDGREARKAVMAWGRKMRCTMPELNVALAQVLDQDREPDTPPAQGKGMSVGELSAFLAATVGGDVDFWERRCAASYTYAVLNAMVQQNAAEGKSGAADPRIRAELALGWAIEKIRERRRGQ